MAIKLEDVGTLIKNVYASNAVLYQNNFTGLIMGEIATDTPQDTGAAKGNWDAGLNDVITPTKEIDLTRTGIRARRKALRQLAVEPITSNLKDKTPPKFNGRDTYIKNGVEGEEAPHSGYIIGLEEGRLSPQAPIGMVLINIVSSDKLAKKAMKL
jgi:hypothetical protein